MEIAKQPGDSTYDAIHQPSVRSESIPKQATPLTATLDNLSQAQDESDGHYSIGYIPWVLASGVAR